MYFSPLAVSLFINATEDLLKKPEKQDLLLKHLFTLLHSEQPEQHRVLAVLRATWLNQEFTYKDKISSEQELSWYLTVYLKF